MARPPPTRHFLAAGPAGWLLGAYMNSKADDLGVDWLAVLDAVAAEIITQYRVNN